MARKYLPAFAIVRIDDFHGEQVDVESRIAIKEVVHSAEEAEREIARLTALNSDKGCRYVCQPTRILAVDAK